MLLINQVKIPVEKAGCIDEEYKALLQAVAKKLNIDKALIENLIIQKKSMDARKKPALFYVYSVTCSAPAEDKILKKSKSADIMKSLSKPYEFKITGTKLCEHRPVGKTRISSDFIRTR